MTTMTINDINYISYDGISVFITGTTNSATIIDVDISEPIIAPITLKKYDVVKINDNAFQNCVNLKTVKLSNKMNTIGINAFINCTSLETINLPNSITNIYSGAFQNCTSLTTIILPNKLIALEDNLFKNCSNLYSIIIPDTILSLGLNVFQNCIALTTIVLPKSITTYNNIFDGCMNLEEVIFTGDISILIQSYTNTNKIFTAYIYGEYNTPTNISYLSNYFEYINFMIERHGVIYGLTNIDMTAKILSADKTATEYFLINKINNYTVNNITNYAFAGCVLVREMTIPNSIIYIHKYAFLNCVLLKRIYIPESVIVLQNYIFNGCETLTDVIFTSSSLPTMIDNNGIKTDKITNVYIKRDVIPQIILENYFENVMISNPTVEKENVIYEIDILRNFASIIGTVTNELDSYELYSEIEYNSCNYIVKIIGIQAFTGCRLTSIIIPDTIIEIKQSAFKECTLLENIIVPDSVVSIGGALFYGCTNLINVILSDNISYIYDETFRECINLRIIHLPKALKAIYPLAFNLCSSLVDLILPDLVELINDGAFSGCTSLTNIKLPDNLKYIIADAVFTDCTSLKYIELSPMVIGENIFQHCNNLETVKFTNNYTIGYSILGSSLFHNRLQDLYINYPCLNNLWEIYIKQPYSTQCIIHISLFSPSSNTLINYNEYFKIVYEYYKLDNFLIGTRNQQLYNYKLMENLAISKYEMDDKQFIYLPNECTIYDTIHKIDYILNNTFDNIKIVVFPSTKFIIEENAFTNAETFIFTGALPELNNTIKYKNAYITSQYNTRSNIAILKKYFTNVYVRFPMGIARHTRISCFVNNGYRDVYIEKLKTGDMVRSLNGNIRVLKVIRVTITQNMYVSNNLRVSPFAGILTDTRTDNDICYGKIDNRYIVSANTLFSPSPTNWPEIIYNIVFDTTNEFNCYYANNVQIVTPVIVM
jgi:hypothetical protein